MAEQRKSTSSQPRQSQLYPSGTNAQPEDIPTLEDVYRSKIKSQSVDSLDASRTRVPEIRSKTHPREIAAALEAVQRLTIQGDSERGAEEIGEEAISDPGQESGSFCRACGYQNRGGNKFCGMCGSPVDLFEPVLREPSEPLAEEKSGFDPEQPGVPDLRQPPAETSSAPHHYHHHYHHHYFPEGSGSANFRSVSQASREAEKIRLPAPVKGEPMSRAETAIRRLMQEWVSACNTKQLDDLLDLYVTDPVLLRTNLPPVRGAAAVREHFFVALDSGFGDVEVEPVRVDVAGDMAYGAGRCAALVPSASGKRREERGKYLWVFAKQNDGSWKLAADCWSSDLTLAAGSESDAAHAPGAMSKTTLPRKSA